MPDKVASRDGDDIVIRVPIQTLHEMMAEAATSSMLQHPVIIRREGEFVAALLAALNNTNAVEAMLTFEVAELVDSKSRAVEEHRPISPRRRRAA